MTPPPTSIDGTEITGATIDGQEVQEITVDGQTVFTALTIPDSEVYLDTSSNATTSFVSNSDSWQFTVDLGGNSANGEVMAGFISPIDFSRVQTLNVEWEKTSSVAAAAANFGADVDQSVINDSDIDNDVPEYNLQNKIKPSFSRTTESITVGTDPDNLHVGVGLEYSANKTDAATLTVYRVFAEDSSGSVVWEMDIPGNL